MDLQDNRFYLQWKIYILNSGNVNLIKAEVMRDGGCPQGGKFFFTQKETKCCSQAEGLQIINLVFPVSPSSFFFFFFRSPTQKFKWRKK